MNLKQLEYFKVLAKMEHVTKAAEVLTISQPSLSKAISELEKELGVPLFDRRGKTIHLTKYGAKFLVYITEGLSHIEAGKREMSELIEPLTGQVDICFVYTLGGVFIPELIRAFQADPKHANVRFSYCQTNSRNAVERLQNGDFDLSFCSILHDEPTIHFTKVFEQEMVIIVPKNHRLSGKTEVDIKELDGEDFIAYVDDSGLRPTIDSMIANAGITVNIVGKFEEDYTIAGFVGSSFGVSIIPRLAGIDALPLDAIKITPPYFERYVYLSEVKDGYQSPVVRAFRDFAIEYCSKNYLKTGVKL